MVTNATIYWLNYLFFNVHLRLAQCQITKSDLTVLLDTKRQCVQDTGYYNEYTKDDILADILDLLNCSGLDGVTELTIEKWRDLTK